MTDNFEYYVAIPLTVYSSFSFDLSVIEIRDIIDQLDELVEWQKGQYQIQILAIDKLQVWFKEKNMQFGQG